jgi:malate synthase
VFSRAFGDRVDQKHRLREDVSVGAAQLVDVGIDGGRITEAGLRGNVSVGVQYLDNWLRGNGAAGINDLMEDVATAEVSRCQVWQWVHHGVLLDGDTPVTVTLVEGVLSEEIEALVATGADADLVRAAAGVFREVALSPMLPPFLTLGALALL